MESPHRQMLLNRPTDRALTSREVRDLEAVRAFERREMQMDQLKSKAVGHRVASHRSSNRMSSWVADKSPSQQAFEAASIGRGLKVKGKTSATERVHAQRTNRSHDSKINAFENQKKLDLKVKEAQRGAAGQHDLASPRKGIAQSEWDDAVRQNRTEARKQDLMKSAIIANRGSGVEHDSTHRTWGHLTDAEVADYGLIEGETLDEEGRVIPPWVGRAERYAGPVGEDEVRYPHDYGYGTRGYIEASRGKVPPPQLHLKDKSAAPRRDPDLYNDVSPYVPYGGHWPGYDYNDQFGYGFAHPPVAYGGPMGGPIGGPMDGPPMPYLAAGMTGMPGMPYPGSVPAALQ